MYVKVTGNTDADVQRAIRIFNKKVKEAGIIQEIYDRREYVKPSVKKKLKKEEAIRRRIREDKKEQNRRKYNNN
jgi:ribosomal protein S21|tara:strand:- start:2813 stop:3034 length:222 start_codon:yes stop_codon:yes gene_type:complete